MSARLRSRAGLGRDRLTWLDLIDLEHPRPADGGPLRVLRPLVRDGYVTVLDGRLHATGKGMRALDRWRAGA